MLKYPRCGEVELEHEHVRCEDAWQVGNGLGLEAVLVVVILEVGHVVDDMPPVYGARRLVDERDRVGYVAGSAAALQDAA